MAKIKNVNLKGLSLSFKDTKISFDMDGISEDIKSDYANELANLDCYELLDDNKSKDKQKKSEDKSNKKDPNENLTVAEIKKMLDEKGVKYSSRLGKEELLKLL